MIRKKIIVLIAIITVIMGACKKNDWNCECYMFGEITPNYWNTTKKSAIRDCNDLNDKAKMFSSSGNCELKQK